MTAPHGAASAPPGFALNQMTIRPWGALEAIDACAAAGIAAIGLWRDPVAEAGIEAVVQRLADTGIRVSSLCRGGFLTADDGEAALDDNRRAIEEAAALGAACLVLVVGGLPDGSRDLPAARGRVAERLAALVPHAAAHGVQLALEPLHPMYCADRAVLSTLAQALDLAEPFAPDEVGVVVDTFHLWWDPDVEAQVARAAGRIASYQVSDWITPLPPDTLLARGVMGDGHIDFAWFGELVAAAGYRGDVEVEIFNQQLWDRPPADALREVLARFAEHCAGPWGRGAGGGAG